MTGKEIFIVVGFFWVVLHMRKHDRKERIEKKN